MVQLEYHIFGDCVFCGIARSACSNAVFSGIAKFIIHTVNAVVCVVPVTMRRLLDVFWRLSAVVTRLCCQADEFLLRKVEFQPSFASVPLIVFEQRVTGVFSKITTSIGVPKIDFSPRLFSYATTRSRAACLHPTQSRLFFNTTVTSHLRKIMVRVFGVASRDVKDSERPIPDTDIFDLRFLTNIANRFMCFHGTDYTPKWDKFKGKPLRGLTVRRQEEYQKCIGAT